MDERQQILVAYESRHGATREIAERVVESLRAYGEWKVALRIAERVSDLSPYRAVILGSPVYDGRWLPEAETFVRAHERELARLPLWLFSVATFGDTQRHLGELVKREPHGIERLQAVLHPRSYRVFAGVIDAALWPWYGRLFLRVLGGQTGDNRDWLEIDRWIEQIVAALRAQRTLEPVASRL
ncbi:MAG TPA: flavodoxin domain-containing protein [Polyangiales bacterium]|nr:flavodoxin domain-containing protein [Polyangiales bacterium]